MTMYGLSCGYWTDDEAEHKQHWADHKDQGELLTVMDASVLPDNFADLGAMRGCVEGVGTAENRGGEPTPKKRGKGVKAVKVAR